MTDAPKVIPIEPATPVVETAMPEIVGPVVETPPVAPAVEKK